MPMASEDDRQGRPIITTREPAGPKRAGDKGTPGDVALMDAVMLVGACWIFIFLLYFSLRRHNI
jgi:hypothetical protein